jgi:hypothetical protein
MSDDRPAPHVERAGPVELRSPRPPMTAMLKTALKQESKEDEADAAG